MRLLYGTEELDDDTELGRVMPTSEHECTLTLLRQRKVRWGPVEGSWFGDSNWVPSVYSDELEREVYKLNGVCWFQCWATIAELEEGEYNLSL
eukprot:3297445-Amphidinium_carterae.1